MKKSTQCNLFYCYNVDPSDAETFLMELSGFLREFGKWDYSSNSLAILAYINIKIYL